MEPCRDPVSVRVNRLNNQLLTKSPKDKVNVLTRDCLLDTLQTFYEECNADCLKNSDKNIGEFIEKYRKTIVKLKQLRVNLSDFEVKNVIGRGHFGEVHVVLERQTSDVYAMKTVKKYDNGDHKCAFYEEERNIMVLANSPWITKLQYAFQDISNLYFIMEYHAGGDLLGLLYRQGGTLPESAAIFYIAELVVAINDLHQLGYVHRDIKPDNILIDSCGHLKLADFGSAAKLNEKRLVSGGIPVGTADYIAPEVLQSMENKSAKFSGSYGTPCDFWSLGILAYELTIGATPFAAPNTTATYSKIINYAKSLKFPSDILLTQGYISFIKNLLTDESNRLTYVQIIKHAVFKGIDFNSIRDQVPPFVPKINSVDDTSNFNDIQTKKKKPNIENFKTKTHFSGRNLPFIGFSFTTEPAVYMENTKQPTVLKNEEADILRNEIESLQKMISKMNDISQDRDVLEKKMEEKIRKMETLENIRDSLEKELANNIAECQALKRTLDLERKDRSNLERKALDLIKSAKLKWEVAEKTKLDNINRELEEFKQRNNQLAEEIDGLNCQLQEALALTSKHKASVVNIEKLRRSSVIGLESRLEKITADTQSKLVQLQLQLSKEIEEKQSIEHRLTEFINKEKSYVQKLKISEKSCQNLTQKCLESEKTIESLKNEIISLNKNISESNKHEETINHLQNKLYKLKEHKIHDVEREAQINLTLKSENNDLKDQLHSLRAAKFAATDELKLKYEDSVRNLEQQLKTTINERNEFDLQLQETVLNLNSKIEKMNTLEELLHRLQADLSKLEGGSQRENILQEQVQRLELQLVEVSENAALEKQELNSLKTKYWRLEKDITNANLDKKIVERDLKEQQGLNLALQERIHQVNLDSESLKKEHKQSIVDLTSTNELLNSNMRELKDKINALEKKLEDIKNKENDNKLHADELGDIIRTKELQICNTLSVLDEVKLEKNTMEQNANQMKIKHDQLITENEELKRERLQLNTDLQMAAQNIANGQLNRTALREACTLLENQLIEFENILEYSESNRHTLQIEVQNLQQELFNSKANIQEARKNGNEEKSLKLLAETKYKRLEDDNENLQKELNSYKEESQEFKEYSKILSQQLTEFEQKISESDILIKNYGRQFDNYTSENKSLKEDNSKQLTLINNLKESNYKLEHSLNDNKLANEVLIDKVNQLEALLNETMHYQKDRELKSEARIQQQTKLIDFLHSKIDESNKKKRTLSDKIFGHSKKENIPPIAFNYKDLECQLNKEKEANVKLHQEIIKLKAELYGNEEMDIKASTLKGVQLQDEILTQIVQSPNSQKNIYRQKSLQRMHHNIPHRFETKLCTKSTKCAVCLNCMLLGRNMSVCKECNATVHTTCENALLRTCGLPAELVNHYSESVSKINKSVSKTNVKSCTDTNLEGWVKIPAGVSGWEKHYACLGATSLDIFSEPPNNSEIKPIQSFELRSPVGHGKVMLEPLPSEIDVPVAASDLPFIIRVERWTNSTCWPSECLIFMTLSIEDKERWFTSLQSIFNSKDKYAGEIIHEDMENLNVNCLLEVEGTIILGTETGLYTIYKKKLVHILGLSSVYEMINIISANLILMIANDNRVVICADIKHLLCLAQCAPCTKPTLKFKTVNVNNLNEFHIIKASDFSKSANICLANSKQLVILKYDIVEKDFRVQRILDTAQPVSCMLFTEHSLIIGADKYFEVDMNTFEADEFLDASDVRLGHAVKCHNFNSFPLCILLVSKPSQPTEYLICFNEFAIFVDEYGRSTRQRDIIWSHLPTAFYYCHSYLYVVQFNAVEIYEISNETCNSLNTVANSIKLDLPNSIYLGSNRYGIFILRHKQIVHINASDLDSDASSDVTDTVAGDLNISDRFSITSSMIQSLDDNLSEAGTDL